MTDEPLDLDKHRGMAAQNATDIRRALAEVENNARDLRERQAIFKTPWHRGFLFVRERTHLLNI
jgi:hypothetical protein